MAEYKPDTHTPENDEVEESKSLLHRFAAVLGARKPKQNTAGRAPIVESAREHRRRLGFRGNPEIVSGDKPNPFKPGASMKKTMGSIDTHGIGPLVVNGVWQYKPDGSHELTRYAVLPRPSVARARGMADTPDFKDRR